MRLVFAFLFCALTAGCTGAINDFVEGGGGGGAGPGEPSVDSENPAGFKISPGSVMATSATVSMRATVTPTRRQLSSPSVNAEISLHSRRVQ